mgnify:CR=1 FL=1
MIPVDQISNRIWRAFSLVPCTHKAVSGSHMRGNGRILREMIFCMTIARIYPIFRVVPKNLYWFQVVLARPSIFKRSQTDKQSSGSIFKNGLSTKFQEIECSAIGVCRYFSAIEHVVSKRPIRYFTIERTACVQSGRGNATSMHWPWCQFCWPLFEMYGRYYFINTAKCLLRADSSLQRRALGSVNHSHETFLAGAA